MGRIPVRMGLSVTNLKKFSRGLMIFTAGLILGVLAVTSLQNVDRFDLFHHRAKEEARMEDERLFGRASMVPKREELPISRVPKVAFLFLTRGSLPLISLWERFFHGHDKHFSIYVHTHPGYQLNVSKSSLFYGREIPSQDAQWGRITLVDAERRLLANALLDSSNERFVLFSESCIPVYDFPTVYKYLMDSVHSFVESYDSLGSQGRGRYSQAMDPLIKISDWRKGSQWFELNRFLALDIISDTKYYPLMRRFCTPTCYPDEHYLPTYLHMLFPTMNANRSVTWVDWTRGGSHPSTYDGPNITKEFIHSIRMDRNGCSYNSKRTSICYLFARKFAATALEPLMDLAATVMNF